MADMLAFLCGEFQNIREKSMNIKDALGWSFTFMKCGLAAFLLLLLESDQMQIGRHKDINGISGIPWPWLE